MTARSRPIQDHAFDVIALGEMVIDFSPIGFSSDGNPIYEQHAGGAAANVAVAVAKLGGRSAFVGSVGGDQFGRFLRQTLRRYTVDDTWLVDSSEAPTTLAFVHLDESGERSFSVAGFPGAESRLHRTSIDPQAVGAASILHLSSAVLYAEPSRSTAISMLGAARAARTMTSFDVNYRAALWSPDEARALAADVLPQVDVLKVSLEELDLLTGTDDLARGAKALLARGPQLIAVTLGPQGSFYATEHGHGEAAGYPVQTIDTNGAGDAFLAALLWRLAKSGPSRTDLLAPDELDRAFEFSNAAGALATSRPGAINASPTLSDIAGLQAATSVARQHH